MSEAERRRIAARYRHSFGDDIGRKALDRTAVERGFTLLNEALARDGIKATVNLVGGVVMLLAHEIRPKTQNIDGWVALENHIEKHILAVGKVLGDERWLNEQALMYFPDKHQGKGDWLPWRDYGNLIVQTADERTMFAMKALALRNAKDRKDFQYLAEILNVRTTVEAMAIVSNYYSDASLDSRARSMITEVLDELDSRRC